MVNIQHNVWVSQRFLDEIENVAHSSPYIVYGGGLYGYSTDADDPHHGVGIISFRYLPNDIVYAEGISINLSNYSLLIENNSHDRFYSFCRGDKRYIALAVSHNMDLVVYDVTDFQMGMDELHEYLTILEISLPKTGFVPR